MVGRRRSEALPPVRWREVISAEKPTNGRYIVSNHGELRHEYRSGKYRVLTPVEQTHVHGSRRLIFAFSKNYKKKEVCMQRIVWEAFNGPVPEGYGIVHINGDHLDNALWNLKKVNRREIGSTYGHISLRNGRKEQNTIAHIDREGNVIAFYRSCRDAEAGYRILNRESILQRCKRNIKRDMWLPDGTTFCYEDDIEEIIREGK